MNIVVRDNLFAPDLLAAVRAGWPAADWPGWVVYDPATQCKRASDLAAPLPGPCGIVLAQMAALPVSEWFGEPVLPDLGLWGAGLHEMPPGPGVNRHLDADTHPRLGLARALSGVLWLDDPSGGELMLYSGATIRPVTGRLCVFDCRNEWHEVRSVSETRRSLALFWYALAVGDGTRLRARFDERP